MKTIRHSLRSASLALLFALPTAIRATQDADPYWTDSTHAGFSDAAFFAKINLDYSPGLNSTIYTGFTKTVKEYVADSDWGNAKGALLEYFRLRQAGTAPALLEISPAIDPELSDHVDHIFQFYANPAFDVDDPDYPVSTNPNYPFGDIDWRTVPVGYPSNWIYQLSKFAYAVSIGADWKSKWTPSTPASDAINVEANNVITMLCDYIHDIGCSTVAEEGPGYCGGLQASSRMLNWSNLYFLLMDAPDNDGSTGGNSIAEPVRMTAILKHLWQMADWTTQEENFLGYYNNRGLTQTRALDQVATYFPEFIDSSGWHTLAKQRAQIYAQSNIYADGALGEPALGYNQYQMSQLYGLQKLARANGDAAYSVEVENLAERRLTYWADTIAPNGQLFLIGDTSFAGTTAAMAAMAADTTRTLIPALPRNDIAYVNAIATGVAPVNSGLPGHTSTIYRHGVGVMRNGWEIDSRVAFIENQPAGNHSHPDNLSFCLYGYGSHIIVNSGRNSYDNSDTIANWHDSTTEANSTIQIDSRPTKSFGEKINQWVTQAGFDFFDGEYRDALAEGLPPSDDTYVDKAHPDMNYGTSKTTKVYQNEPNYSTTGRVTYFKFKPGTKSVGQALTAATVRLYYIEPLNTSTPVNLSVYGIRSKVPTGEETWRDIIAGDWNELNLTWDGFMRSPPSLLPDATPDSNGDVYLIDTSGGQAEFLGTLTYTSGPAQWLAFSNSALESFIDDEMNRSTDGTVTLAITNDQTQNKTVSLGVRKSAFRPALELEVDYTPWSEVITHRRKVYFDRSDVFVVSDLLTGAAAEHQYEQLWHINANAWSVTLNNTTKCATALVGSPSTANVRIATGDVAKLAEAALKDGWMTEDEDDPPLENQRLAYVQRASGPVTFDTVIQSGSGVTPRDLQVTRLALGVGTNIATALKISLDASGSGDTIYYYLSHSAPIERIFGDSSQSYDTDGELAAVRKSEAGSLQTVALKSGNLIMDGTTVLLEIDGDAPASDLLVDYRTGGKLIVSSSRPLMNTISIYSPATVTAVEFNGESVPFSIAGNYYTIERKLLISEDFETENAARWTTSSGSHFKISDFSGNKVYECMPWVSNPSSETWVSNAVSTVGESTWGETAIEATIQIDKLNDAQESNRVGIVGWYVDSGHYFACVYDRYTGLSGGNQGKLRIVERVPGSFENRVGKNFQIHLNSSYKFKAILTGRTIDFYVNNHLELSYEVPSGFGSIIGKAGVIVDRAQAFIDDFSVTGGVAEVVTAANTTIFKTLTPYGNSYANGVAPYFNLFDEFLGSSSARLSVSSDPNENPRPEKTAVSYLKFRLEDYGGSSLSAARLRFYGQAMNYATLTDPVDISIYAIPVTEWTDRQMTWNNRPALGSGTLVGVLHVKNPGWYEVVDGDLLSYLSAHLGTEVDFMLVADNSDGHSPEGETVEFISNVYVNKPELTLGNVVFP